jgi:hypothetical protein
MRTVRTHLWILVLFVWQLAGCPGEVDHVVLEIAAGDWDPVAELATLEITVTASRTTAGDELCEPYTVSFSLDGSGSDPISLPFTLEFEPGNIYNKIVFVRVVGRQDGTVRYKTERMASLTGGDVRVQVEIDEACLDVGTGERHHCADGQSVESPFWRIFDESEFVQAGEACRVH